MSFKELDDQIEQLASSGLRVKIWKIPRTQNKEADRLANEAQDQLLRSITSMRGVHGDADEGMKEGELSDFRSVFMMSARRVHEDVDEGMKEGELSDFRSVFMTSAR